MHTYLSVLKCHLCDLLKRFVRNEMNNTIQHVCDKCQGICCLTGSPVETSVPQPFSTSYASYTH